MQGENKIAAQLKIEMILGDSLETRVKLMFMGMRDYQGRFENVWELISDLEDTAQ